MAPAERPDATGVSVGVAVDEEVEVLTVDVEVKDAVSVVEEETSVVKVVSVIVEVESVEARVDVVLHEGDQPRNQRGLKDVEAESHKSVVVSKVVDTNVVVLARKTCQYVSSASGPSAR